MGGLTPSSRNGGGDSTTKIGIFVKWCGKEYEVENIIGLRAVRDLKEVLEAKTGVKVERQKILNMKFKGKTAEDDCLLANLAIKDGQRFFMMGSLEKDIETVEAPPPGDLPNVINDLDIPSDDDVCVHNKQVNLMKVAMRVAQYKMDVINPPRQDKKLLVLDIDYTLYDNGSAAERIEELMRPFLHDFLTSAYTDYDIAIWSANSMKWIKEKMKMMGVSTHPSYKITFHLDNHAMITVDTEKYGVVSVKPLGVIWGQFPQYSPKNTIMFDDLRRNFLMNPQSGLKIKPFKSAHTTRHTDTELLKLTEYLQQIASLDDFQELNHNKWEKYVKKSKSKSRERQE